MNREQNTFRQRLSKVLLFPMAFFNEVVRTFRYLRRSLSLSMRRRISFDYLIMYLMVSVITITVFGLGYDLLQAKAVESRVMDDLFNLAVLRDKGTLTDQALEQQIQLMGQEENLGLEIRSSTRFVPDDSLLQGDILGQQTVTASVVQSDTYPASVYDMRYVENLWLFFGRGVIKHSETKTYIFEDGSAIRYNLQLVQVFHRQSLERRILIWAILVSQIIGVSIISVVGSYRLRRVFTPVYAMTKAAENITINNMDAKLDVARAEYELKDLAATFNDMIDRIRTDYVKQKRFVSDVSHELRTPISIVNGYSRMLDRWGKNDEAILEESIDAIKNESKNMQVLVENLLTLVRSDNQTLKFEKDEFMLDDLGNSLMKDMALIDEGRHSFEQDLQRNLKVCLDYAKTKQTLRIFLDNAIKYTPEGGAVTLRMHVKDELVTVMIEDTGIGISKEDLPHLFERFYRSDESRTRETGGHGLGLAIAKAMVIGQNGRIRVKSKPGEGSTFVLDLPIRCEE